MRLGLLGRVATAGTVLALWLWLPPAPSPAAPAADPVLAQVGQLEHRFFFRLYARDPVEKRLERLELLVFGGIQPGSSEERLARLKKTITNRDSRSGDIARQKPGPAESPGAQKPAPPASAKQGSGSSQYPILNTLEWRALKKTYGKDSLDERLDRLETKLFGQPSPAMAYADRVERLKRTLGVGIAQAPAPLVPGPLGPKPKARPHAPGDFYGGGIWPPEFSEPFGGDETNPGSPLFGPDIGTPFGMAPGFSDMFRQLERQMEQLQRMPSGVWQWDPQSGAWISPRSGRQFKPAPGQEPPGRTPSAPFSPAPRRQPVIPPYGDPNSI